MKYENFYENPDLIDKFLEYYNSHDRKKIELEAELDDNYFLSLTNIEQKIPEYVTGCGEILSDISKTYESSGIDNLDSMIKNAKFNLKEFSNQLDKFQEYKDKLKKKYDVISEIDEESQNYSKLIYEETKKFKLDLSDDDRNNVKKNLNRLIKEQLTLNDSSRILRYDLYSRLHSDTNRLKPSEFKGSLIDSISKSKNSFEEVYKAVDPKLEKYSLYPFELIESEVNKSFENVVKFEDNYDKYCLDNKLESIYDEPVNDAMINEVNPSESISAVYNGNANLKNGYDPVKEDKDYEPLDPEPSKFKVVTQNLVNNAEYLKAKNKAKNIILKNKYVEAPKETEVNIESASEKEVKSPSESITAIYNGNANLRKGYNPVKEDRDYKPSDPEPTKFQIIGTTIASAAKFAKAKVKAVSIFAKEKQKTEEKIADKPVENVVEDIKVSPSESISAIYNGNADLKKGYDPVKEDRDYIPDSKVSTLKVIQGKFVSAKEFASAKAKAISAFIKEKNAKKVDLQNIDEENKVYLTDDLNFFSINPNYNINNLALEGKGR